jgi:hypothetical protein
MAHEPLVEEHSLVAQNVKYNDCDLTFTVVLLEVGNDHSCHII